MISVVIQTKSTLTSHDDISPSGQIKNDNGDKNKMITIKRNRTTMPSLAVLVIVALYATPCPTTAAAAGTSPKTVSSGWAQNDPARFYIPKYESTTHHKFIGNHSDYFKILHQDEDTILVGGKNALYNLSVATLQELPNTRIQWFATDAHRQLCMLKGKHESECQNYIRVYGKVSERQFLLCGTNAYKPQCRQYNTQRSTISSHEAEDEGIASDEDTSAAVAVGSQQDPDYDNEEEAQGRCPYNPQHSSAYVFAGKHSIVGSAWSDE